jgi:hypothetical protein
VLSPKFGKRVVEQNGFLDPEYLFFSVSGCVLSVEHYEFPDPVFRAEKQSYGTVTLYW